MSKDTPFNQSAKPSNRKPDPNIAQRQASDPTASVWVTASAGTGKTKVLTDRVLRLMLEGAAPESILCVTFTTAAAALMTIRIREELSQWTTMSDADLSARLQKLTGDTVDTATRDRARRLFAQFLDAGEGMRIQTIHALAQDLIRRFPIESGIPPYFSIMDDQTAADLLRDARAEVLRDVQKYPKTALAKAVRMVTPEVGEDDFVNLIGELTYRRGELLSIIEEKGGLEATIEAIYDFLDAPQDTDSERLNRLFNSDGGLDGDAPDIDALSGAADVLLGGSAADIEKAKMIKMWLLHPEQRADIFWDYAAVFLTADGSTRKTLATKKCEAAVAVMEQEAERLKRGIEYITGMNVARGTESILRLTAAILEAYSERKRTLNLLDFDDLIHSVNVMMREDGMADWVLHKLPGDVRHILVDEAQDTNPDQWALVGSFVQALFKQAATASTPAKPGLAPTLFVVGDEKQSIFSFQRADPREFARRKKAFADMIKAAGGTWREVQMDIAFRSSPAITRAVDAVFANPAASDGLFSRDAEGRQVHHDAFRRGQAGLVEIHPVVTGEPTPEPAPWALPLPSDETGTDPGAVLADKIADQIKTWLDTKEKLPSRNRAMSPSDIMILVRRRSAFVDQLVRALKKRDIPVSGADRMSLREQIVVMDLVAVGEWLLFPRDDYKLACVLKSPLLGLNDQQLEDIAVGRKGDLWTALRDAAAGDKADPALKNAVAYLQDLKARFTSERPYEFYSGILFNDCAARRPDGKSQAGANALYARLGFEAEDPMVEFMNAIERYEKTHVPSLQGFLSWLEAGEAEVKRQINLNPESPRVNIMTVHSAKGLEAPVVILPDTTGLPEDNTRARPRFLWPDGDRDVPLWVPRADLESNRFRAERHAAEAERDREFRRLLYVAMTRAADRLYVYGYQNAARQTDKSWYELITHGLKKELGDEIRIDDTGVIRFETPQTAKPQPDGVKPQKSVSVVGVPAWARHIPAAPQKAEGAERFRPSDYFSTNDNIITAASPLLPPADDYHIRLGTAVHALLEFLPGVEGKGRDDIIKGYLAQPRWNLDPADQRATAKQVKAVLDDARFGALFGPKAKAEVSITGKLYHDNVPKLLSGQVDRLLIDDKTVTIVDYKNGRNIPLSPEKAPRKYIVQMAAYRLALQQIYPDKDVRCALLWTRRAEMMELPSKLLDNTLAEVKLTATPVVEKPATAVVKKRRPKAG